MHYQIGLALAIFSLVLPGVSVAFSDGDLISSPLHSSVYQVQDGKRRAFFNQTIFLTHHNNFSAVKKVSVAEVEALELGTPMPVASNTKLIKFPLNPRIYNVEAETLRYIPDGDTAKAMFGANWESRIIELPEIYYLFYAKAGAYEKVVPGNQSKVQTYKSVVGQYQFDLPTSWLTPREAVGAGPAVYGLVGTVAGQKVLGDYSVYIGSINGSSAKDAVSNYIAAQQGKVQLIDSATEDIPGGKVTTTRFLNKRALEEDEYIVFSLKEGVRYAVMTAVRMNGAGSTYEDGLMMILKSFRPL